MLWATPKVCSPVVQYKVRTAVAFAQGHLSLAGQVIHEGEGQRCNQIYSLERKSKNNLIFILLPSALFLLTDL